MLKRALYLESKYSYFIFYLETRKNLIPFTSSRYANWIHIYEQNVKQWNMDGQKQLLRHIRNRVEQFHLQGAILTPRPVCKRNSIFAEPMLIKSDIKICSILYFSQKSYKNGSPFMWRSTRVSGLISSRTVKHMYKGWIKSSGNTAVTW
jgi:hypothetical protein